MRWYKINIWLDIDHRVYQIALAGGLIGIRFSCTTFPRRIFFAKISCMPRHVWPGRCLRLEELHGCNGSIAG